MDYLFGAQSENLMEICVSRGVLQELFKFKGEHIPLFFGLPDDAILVHIGLDSCSPGIRLLFKHPDFPEVTVGTAPPRLNLSAVAVTPCEHTKEEIRQIIKEYNNDVR